LNKFKLGIILTIGWLIFLIVILFLKGNITDLSLNEIGDFLAGFFAPTAFLWLILGYMQQGDELKSNTQALIEQKEEYSKNIKLSAYSALVNFEVSEMNLLNSLGEQYKEGAKNARTRATQYKTDIEQLLKEIESS